MPREISISVTEILISAAEMIIKEPATVISKRETVISAPDAVMSGPHIIIHTHDAIMSALETVIGAAETSICRAEIAISAFGTSFLAAEISISAAKKTTGAAPAGLFPIASQPSTNRLAFVPMAEVRPGSVALHQLHHDATRRASAFQSINLRDLMQRAPDSRWKRARRSASEANISGNSFNATSS